MSELDTIVSDLIEDFESLRGEDVAVDYIECPAGSWAEVSKRLSRPDTLPPRVVEQFYCYDKPTRVSLERYVVWISEDAANVERLRAVCKDSERLLDRLPQECIKTGSYLTTEAEKIAFHKDGTKPPDPYVYSTSNTELRWIRAVALWPEASDHDKFKWRNPSYHSPIPNSRMVPEFARESIRVLKEIRNGLPKASEKEGGDVVTETPSELRNESEKLIERFERLHNNAVPLTLEHIDYDESSFCHEPTDQDDELEKILTTLHMEQLVDRVDKSGPVGRLGTRISVWRALEESQGLMGQIDASSLLAAELVTKIHNAGYVRNEAVPYCDPMAGLSGRHEHAEHSWFDVVARWPGNTNDREFGKLMGRHHGRRLTETSYRIPDFYEASLNVLQWYRDALTEPSENEGGEVGGKSKPTPKDRGRKPLSEVEYKFRKHVVAEWEGDRRRLTLMEFLRKANTWNPGEIIEGAKKKVPIKRSTIGTYRKSIKRYEQRQKEVK